MPTEENQNVKTGSNPMTGDQPITNNDDNNSATNVADNNMDIDLNLDGVSMPTESKVEVEVPTVKEVKEEVKSMETKGDDRLAEEDKKVEALQIDKIVEPIVEIKPEVVEDIITKKENLNPVETLLESTVPVVSEDIELEQLEELESIVDDIKPIVEKVQEEAAQEVKQETEIKTENKVQGQMDLDNLDFAEEPIEELHTEDLGEVIVENKEGDILSDTGDIPINPNSYMPNEHDFGVTSEALDMVEKGGAIDLGLLETNKDESKNLEVGFDDVVNLNINEAEGGLNLDTMISDLGSTNDVVVDLPVSTPVIQIQSQAVEEILDQPINQPINEIVNEPVNVVQNIGEMPNNLNKKSSHAGLKIFLFVIVLLVGGIFVLSKMYPQEVSDIMSAIKGEDTTVIEYSDNADMGTVLDETQDVLQATGNVVEKPDPDSLAGQLEGNNLSGSMDNTMEYATGMEDTGHNAEMVKDDFDVFGGLNDVMDTVTSENAELLENLHEYKDKGEEYNIWGRGINNTTAMKYGSYISKKASEAITDIENGIKIDIVKIENYFAQFDKYLEKLSALRISIDGEAAADVAWQVQDDALVSTGTDEQPTSSTGTVQ